MAQQTIGVGAAANDGNGDDLRAAFVKVNDNFDELYGSGTWTPVLAGESTAGDFTYATQAGYYVASGEFVECFFNLITSAETVAAVGSMQITGLPFTGVNGHSGGAIHRWQGINFATSYTHVGPRVPGAATTIDLYVNGDNVNDVRLDAADVGTVVHLRGSVTYVRSI